MNFRHCGLVVDDVEKSIVFYTQMLGFQVEKDNLETGKFIDLICGLKNTIVRTVKMSLNETMVLELLQFQSHPSGDYRREITNRGFTHIALTVDNLDEVYNRLQVDGLEFHCLPQISPDGNAKVTFCRDPEGNLLELVEEIR
jgi:catechol 2,3-dioxygenase-like lactoylglutathione lyase family enzyme